MGFIKRAWRGEAKLWVVFWLWGFLFPLLASLLLTFVIAAVPALTIPIGVLWLVYVVWWIVAVWKCSFNVGARFWGYLARIYMCAAPVLIVVGILVGAFSMAGKIITIEKCREQMNAEADAQGIDRKTYAHQHANECLKAQGSDMRLNRVPEGASPEHIKACEAIFEKEAVSRNQNPGAFRALHGDEFQKCVYDQMRAAADTPSSPLIRISLPPEIAQNPAAPACIDQLKAHAEKNGVADVKAYVTQNNEWVIQCVKQAKVQP